jgi:hypothetical protein
MTPKLTKSRKKQTSSCLIEIWAFSYIFGPCLQCHIAGNFFLPSQDLNSDVKIPLEILGSVDVNRLFERVKQPLQG